MILETSIIWYQSSITGRRSNNEDYSRGEKISEKTWLFAVADGMGGGEKGEVASRLAVDTLFNHVYQVFSAVTAFHDIRAVLKQGFEMAQKVIRETIANDSSHTGMGTTLVALLISDGFFVWGNIGDSRLYKIDSNGIEQLTKDHTYIEDVLLKNNDKNVITPEILQQYSHIITRSISGGNDYADIYPEDGDYSILGESRCFILCSDGLIINKSDKSDEEEFLKICRGEVNIETIPLALIGNSFERGSSDNITVLFVLCGKRPLSISGMPINKRRRNTLIKVSTAITITALVILLGYIIFFKVQRNSIAEPQIAAQDTLKAEIVPKVSVSDSANSWKAFKSVETLPLTPDSEISFEAISDEQRVLKYEAFLKEMSGKIIDTIKIQKGENASIPLSSFTRIRTGTEYIISITATMIDRSVIPGGQMKIKTRN